MIRIVDHLAGDELTFYCVQSTEDLRRAAAFVRKHRVLAFDTESTGLNCYRPDWRLRTFQFGHATVSWVVPQQFRKFIEWFMRRCASGQLDLIGHNAPHDVRSTDAHLGYETGVVAKGETYIPLHYYDSRNQSEGGIGHGLKDGAEFFVDRDAGKWERKLKEEFKKIEIPIPGEVYKSGPKKGTQKVRKAKLAEGWSLIDPYNPVYLAYAAADPVLTYRLWPHLKPYVMEFRELYDFDHAVAQGVDRLYRRAIKLDSAYTSRLSKAFTKRADYHIGQAAAYGCGNINSTAQVADTLIALGAKLTAKTPTEKWKVDATILRGLLDNPYTNGKVRDFIHNVLVAKQITKRRENYTEGMLREMDAQGRVHPSTNSLAARTTRMSVSGPPLQQLPTKDREDELLWDTEETDESI